MIAFLAISLVVALIVFLVWIIPSKGTMGERRVARMLSKKLPEDYVVVNDITIPCSLGTTQIDHIVFSTHGIFVIETKNYSGWITGADKAEYWQKNMYGYKYRFRNPIKQNYAHVKALQAMLPLGNHYFRSIVTFANSASLRNRHNAMVVNNRYLIETILQFSSIVIPQAELQKHIDTVLNSALVEKDMRKQHVRNVKSNVEFRNWKIKNNICPRCGGTIVERKGKYGRFYGCSNYPNCKFTLSR